MLNRFATFKRMLVLCLALIWSSSVFAGSLGSVTSIVALNHEASAFVGYSSGAVAFCSGQPYPCQFYQGTPNSPVTAMDTSRGGSKDQYWVFVGFENGETYVCRFTRTRTCRALQASP